MLRAPFAAALLAPALLAAVLVAAALLTAAGARAQPAGPVTRQPAGTILVPDRFLRRWDPVTLFFDHDAGPAKGGPEDMPGRLVTMTPAQPGAWTWLNARTLQFRPAEPWPALGRFTWRLGGREITLSRLLEPALRTVPAGGAADLDPVDSIELDFAEPVEVKALAQMIDIALTPLPGLDPAHARHLAATDFDIKPLQRSGRDDQARYVVALHQPIANGMQAVVALGLSPDPGLEGTVQRIRFSTADAFRPAFIGCGAVRLPLAAEGTVYDKAAAVACQTESVREDGAAPEDDSASSAPEGEEMAGGAAEGEEGGDEGQDVGKAVVDASAPKPSPASTREHPAQGATPPAPARAAQVAARREVVVHFSALLGALDPLAARSLVRITPAVGEVKAEAVGDEIRVRAKFAADTLYQVTLEPTDGLKDRTGRPLAVTGRSTAWLYWPMQPDFLKLGAGNGVLERFGPQMIPLEGRGYRKADVRIHAVDPLDRSFWSFPRRPIETDDSARPPAEGEAAAPHTEPDWTRPSELADQIARLGSPSVSALMALPLTPLGPSARFGLDLAPALERIAGKQKPGTYLVGIKPIDRPDKREWIRIQVTDLSLTAVEEEAGVRFFVTALSTGKPVAQARLSVEGVKDHAWQVLAGGLTAADGSLAWLSGDKARGAELRRIVVAKDDDTLVLDRGQPPDRYTADGWQPGAYGWLEWMTRDTAGRHPLPRLLCHVFTERPIYRPDDPVHIKAYVRQLADGLLAPPATDLKAEIVVGGPGDVEWRYPVTLAPNGSVHYLFDERTTATGLYQARIEIKGAPCAKANFKKDAYRLPRFQVRLAAPPKIALDKPAEVGMTAIYYAGGPAANRPVRWRVTQFPYAFAPQPREGFVYATDSRYQAHAPFEGSAAIERQDTTDGEGRASLTLDPGRESSNQPRRYVVEATVTGDDDRTVTNTEQVLALPAFVLALKAPRYLEQARSVPVEALMVDPDGKPIAGQPVTVRLLQRQWSSILEASDFTDGKAKYHTETVDEKRLERTITTGAEPVRLELPIEGAGVYIVEIEAQDGLGRRQTVSVDLFAGGGQPVTWSRPPAQVFKVTPDKPAYAPGETAKLVLESPFQTARALAVTELPDGRNRYAWVDVANGYGTFALPVEKAFLPRLPVHFALMRGRLAGRDAPGAFDLRRPETIAATAWVGVKPVKNIVTTTVEAPAAAQPGDTIELTVRLADDQGKPLSGEVTLWLIDQAVLALAQEAPLDPLPGFIRDRGSRVAFSDTRNWPFGLLPLDEDPGGDVGEGDQQLLNKVTIRRNFQPVPYYNPELMVDASGVTKVSVKLPDDLTIFRIRAKAVSGPDRFGFATGQIAVRLPVIVEPNLPRFVRPGDAFDLAGIGRITEGGGGPGRVELRTEGLDVAAAGAADFAWEPKQPHPFAFPATVPSPGYDESGALSRTTARVTMAVERTADHARDAFQVDLPILPDRAPSRRRELVDLADGSALALRPIDGAARPGTVRRTLTLSSEPALVRLAAGLNYLREYPFGCTEQRVSLARAELAAKRFGGLLGDGADAHANHSVAGALEWLPTVTQDSGLISYWPGSGGSVVLTAWTVEFLIEARKAGYAVDPSELGTLERALHQALRSDYAHFVSGAAYVERAWALAALADAGQLDSSYAAELARDVDQLSLEGIAQVRLALASGTAAPAPLLQPLDDALWRGVIIRQRAGRDVYGGLQDGRYATLSPIILPSETRVLAEMLSATAAGSDPRRALLADALVTLGQGSGWGSTNSDAEALMALARFYGADTGAAERTVALALAGAPATVTLSGAHPIERLVTRDGSGGTVTAADATAERRLAVLSDLVWLPSDPGSEAAPAAAGFVVSREAARLDPAGGPATRLALDKAGLELKLALGDVVEDSIRLVNPADRYHVAITVPLAAGMEPLNPTLATAPPEATPSAPPTLRPTFVAMLDDKVQYFYDSLPKGTYELRVRTKATVPGRFIQPAAEARLMYDDAVAGSGAGAVVTIARPAGP